MITFTTIVLPILAAIATMAAPFALAGLVLLFTHCSVYGFKFTTKIPGGLLAAMSTGSVACKSVPPDALGICLVHFFDHEHYTYLSLHKFCAIICLNHGTPYSKYVTVPRWTKGYDTIVKATESVEVLEEWKNRLDGELA